MSIEERGRLIIGLGFGAMLTGIGIPIGLAFIGYGAGLLKGKREAEKSEN